MQGLILISRPQVSCISTRPRKISPMRVRSTALLAQGGLARRELSAEEVLAKEPTLRGDILGGYWTESDSTGDIHKFTVGLAEWLRQQGVQFKMGHAVRRCGGR